MRIDSISAGKTDIVFSVEANEDVELTIRETAPTIGEKSGREIAVFKATTRDGRIALPRFDGGHDRIYSAFFAYFNGETLEGARYITEISPDVPENKSPYPQPNTIKALHGTPEDIRELGIKQCPYNINLCAVMTMDPCDDDIIYIHNGREYYFLKDAVNEIDGKMRLLHDMGVVVTFILLNSPTLFNSTREKRLYDMAIHPRYDWESPSTYISAFDMRTENGQNCYMAFAEFLFERYTRTDNAYGHAAGAIVSNEVNSQYVWGNAGEMTAVDYTREYTQALRLAWICGQKHCRHFRVYVSLDHYWHGLSHMNGTEPLRYYPGRTVIDNINTHAQRDGNFPWHVAYHPYPENLVWPDFWNDRSPDFTFSTPRITFKNMEILPAYLGQEQFLYNGEQRRIVFSEQGFNSHNGDFAKLTEEMGEAGYVLAYLKARNIKTVDMLMHHAYVDNPREFGLNLGIRRYNKNAPMCAGEKKPIYQAVSDMDTDAEPERIKKARAYIGEALFDYLLNPSITYGERDTARDGEFG